MEESQEASNSGKIYPLSEAKASANRQNALKSTGPRDTSLTRFNALKHGLTAKRIIVMSKEDPAEYEALLEALRQDFQPKTSVEEILIQQMGASIWRRQRLVAREKNGIEERIACAAISFRDSEKNRRYDSERDLSPDMAIIRTEKEKLHASKKLKDLDATLELRKKLYDETRMEPCFNDQSMRYDSNLERQFYRALFALRQIQQSTGNEQL
jgi:hypothetical protein